VHVSQVFEGQEGDTIGIYDDLLWQLESSGIRGGNVFLWHPRGRAVRHRPCAAGQRARQDHHVPVRHLPNVRLLQVLCVSVRHSATQWLLRTATVNIACSVIVLGALLTQMQCGATVKIIRIRLEVSFANALTVRRSATCSGSAGRRCRPCGHSLPARQPATPPACAA